MALVNSIRHQHMFATHIDVRLTAIRSQLVCVHASVKPNDARSQGNSRRPSESGTSSHLHGSHGLHGSNFMTADHRV